MILCPASNGGTSVLGAGRNRTLCSESPLERQFERIYIGFPFARSCHLKPVCHTAWRYRFADAWFFFCRGDRPVALGSGKQQSAGKTTISSHKGTKGKAAAETAPPGPKALTPRPPLPRGEGEENEVFFCVNEKKGANEEKTKRKEEKRLVGLEQDPPFVFPHCLCMPV